MVSETAAVFATKACQHWVEPPRNTDKHQFSFSFSVTGSLSQSVRGQSPCKLIPTLLLTSSSMRPIHKIKTQQRAKGIVQTKTRTQTIVEACHKQGKDCLLALTVTLTFQCRRDAQPTRRVRALPPISCVVAVDVEVCLQFPRRAHDVDVRRERAGV